MKVALLLVLALTFAVFSESEAAWARRAFRGIRGRRIWNTARPYVARWAARAASRAVEGWITGKRGIADMAELDKNLDGLLDQSELEKIMTTRDAKEVLESVDEDGDSAITMAEFEEIFRHLRDMEEEEEIEQSISP